LEEVINPFSHIKELLNNDINSHIFPLKNLISQYQSLSKERWKDLELTTYFLDTVVEVLEIKLKYLFPSNFSTKIKENDEKIKLNISEKWKEVKKYLEEQEEKGIKVFWRDNKKDFSLDENNKINITEIYFTWLNKKENNPIPCLYQKDFYSIEKIMEDILNRLNYRIYFSEISKDLTKLEKIYYFLALCELANQGKINVYQENFFGDILLEIRHDYARL
jgi:chromatin segregation and condensation protein Rec8/ScpA/Scc1 (kleisin family)